MALGSALGRLRLFLRSLLWTCRPTFETGFGFGQSTRIERTADGQANVVLPVRCFYAHSDISRVHSKQFLYQQYHFSSSLLVRNMGHARSLA